MTAEWRDRAEAAAAEIDELDLRDIRSVINAAETAARDDETRALADQLRAGLARRAEEEHAKWLADLTSALSDGRLVRALRLSSHPPKAGAPLPADLKERLKVMTEEGLSDETAQQRYATVLDALAYSPIHAVVVPSGAPAMPDEQLKGAVRKHAGANPADRRAVRHRTCGAHQKPREGSRQGQEEAPSPAASHRGRGLHPTIRRHLRPRASPRTAAGGAGPRGGTAGGCRTRGRDGAWASEPEPVEPEPEAMTEPEPEEAVPPPAEPATEPEAAAGESSAAEGAEQAG